MEITIWLVIFALLCLIFYKVFNFIIRYTRNVRKIAFWIYPLSLSPMAGFFAWIFSFDNRYHVTEKITSFINFLSDKIDGYF